MEAISDKWSEIFAHFEALLSRGNVFSVPKSTASTSAHPVISEKPFINPSAWPTGPVGNPADQGISVAKSDVKPKKKSHKSKTVKSKEVASSSPVPASHIPGPGDETQELVFMPVSAVDTSATGQTVQSAGPTGPIMPTAPQTGPDFVNTGPSPHDVPPNAGFSSSLAGAGPMKLPDPQYRDSLVQALSDYDELSGDDNSIVEEGEVSSDNLEKQEQTEDMTFRETVRSVHSFMGWDHIPVFESDLSEPDKSNNP